MAEHTHGGKGRIAAGIDGTQKTIQPAFLGSFSKLGECFQQYGQKFTLTALSVVKLIDLSFSPIKGAIPGLINTKGRGKG
jgi:hypothetical protein